MSDLAPMQSSDESPPSQLTSQNEHSPHSPTSQDKHSQPPVASESSPPPTSSPSPPSKSTTPNSPLPTSLPDAPPPADDSSSSSPPPSNSNTSPPSDSNSPPPPDSNSPPPSKSNSPPPPNSNSPPPSGSNSPPPSDSDSPPPSDSDFSPPSPPSDVNSSPPSPPSDSSPPTSAPPPKPSDSPPDGPDQPAPPPDESSTSGNSSPPLSPPVQTPPSPPADSPSVQTVAPPNYKTPSSKQSSPPETPSNGRTPPTPNNRVSPSQPAPPTSQISNRTPQLSPPSTKSDSGSSKHASSKSSSDSSKDSDQGVLVVVTLVGVAIIALVAIVFMILRWKKRRVGAYMDHHRPPSSFTGKSDGYYSGQPAGGNSAQLDPYYGKKMPLSYSGGSSYGSNRGNGFNSESMDQNAMGNAKSWFTYEELMNITDGFSQQNVLGEGGFGCVYKGQLPDGRAVAVKQLKAGSGQGEREFRAEVEIISRVHHRHLVSLVGYCIAEHHRLLVFEFVPNNTLEHHLHGTPETSIDWPKRVKIAIGAAKGLAYLHEDCHPRIIHRDIKSANILLDNSFEAQVADFGLAKLTNDTHTHVSTRVMGTFGYLAPEYASSGKLTDRSDVFSFGVVLLELVTGRKPVDASQPLGDESLVEWARPLLIRAVETGEFGELVDPRLENNFKTSEMFRMIEVAAACVRHSASKRPRMVQVVRALDSDGAMQDLTNGVKFGQSTIFEAGQYSVDIRRFQRMAFGSDDYSSNYGPSGEFDQRSTTYSAELRSREAPQRPPNPWNWKGSEPTSSEYPSSSESETRAMFPQGRGRSSD